MPLPVDDILPELTRLLTQQMNVVLQAPPGAGKTTRVPLALLESHWLHGKKIIMLEPRRIAARAAATFMATSLGESPGQTVGYRVRLDSRVSAVTRIEVVTEGILSRMLQDDPALQDVGIVIFDEFHERNLNSDLGLALCLDTQQGLRDDLRILVMSATLDAAKVAALMHDAPLLSSEGRSYPVDIHYRAPTVSFTQDRRQFIQSVCLQVIDCLDKEPGSILVFLPGSGEIHQAHETLQQLIKQQDVILAPLYGQMTSSQQDAAIRSAPQGKRKIVLATSIAETSLTIDGIRIVIDSGLMRLPRFDPNTGLTRLVTQPVSRASAEQRAGRAGRTQPGACYRLWPESAHLLPHSRAEIIDADLAPLLLELAQWGISDVTTLRWLDTPPAAHLAQAGDLLQQLGALDDKNRITAHGKDISRWSAHPRLAHMMLYGQSVGCGDIACEIAALLSDRDILRGSQRDSDLLLRIEALRYQQHSADIDKSALHQVRQVAEQWKKQLGAETSAQDELEMLGVLLACAYPDRIARRRDNKGTRYRLSNGRGAILNESDRLAREEFIVAAHLDGSNEARIFLAAAIRLEQLSEYHPELIQTRHFVSWDARNQCVQARRQQCTGEVVLNDEAWQDASTDAIQQALLDGIRQNGLACLPWNDSARELQARVLFLASTPGNDWPDMSNAALLATMEEWLSPYLNNMSRLSHLQQLDLTSVLLSLLSWQQQNQLNEQAPTHLEVPSGSRIRLDYSQSPPVLAVRLQEMFGLAETPRIANGKVALVLHLLSPAQRPVQITQDLAGFWQSSYHEVKKDLKGRYPKHHWPDDPMQAQPTAKAKRRGES